MIDIDKLTKLARKADTRGLSFHKVYSPYLGEYIYRISYTYVKTK